MIHGLHLDHAGVKYNDYGIQVNKRLQTSNRRIYAMGDVTGPHLFTHMASYQASVIIKNVLFKLRSKVDYQGVPRVTYTSPEFAHVGLLEKEALRDGKVVISEWPFKENDRAQAENKAVGKIKVVSNKKGKILGVTIVGEQAGELMLPWALAIRDKKTLRTFTDVIVPYPTFSEVSKRVAGAFYEPKLFSRLTRSLVRSLLFLTR